MNMRSGEKGNATRLEVPVLLRAGQVADRLGISRSAFYRLHSSGRVPLPVRLGACVRCNAEELDAWINHACPARARWEALKKREGLPGTFA